MIAGSMSDTSLGISTFQSQIEAFIPDSYLKTLLRQKIQRVGNTLATNGSFWIRITPIVLAHMEKLAQIEAPALIRAEWVIMQLRYLSGERGLIPLNSVTDPAPGTLVDYDKLVDADTMAGINAIQQVAYLKLNGGLGTTMGCDGPKSVIKIIQNQTFLDVIGHQVNTLRACHNTPIPLILMNSYNTESESHAIIDSIVPDYRSFQQHQVPRIDSETGFPTSFDNSDHANWNPPGHGDIYASLVTSGELDRLIDSGIRYLFISNADNLGAQFDPKILGHMIRKKYQFLMETTVKTIDDRKGGTLVQNNGRLFLLERAQVAISDIAAFEDIERFHIFNTNNIWIDIVDLKNRLNALDLELPLIVNPKTVFGTLVHQLETAMGSAIGLFDHAASIVVPRTRFLPVKTTADLLILRSNAVAIQADGTVAVNAPQLPSVKLDHHYQTVAQLDHAVSHPLELIDCRALQIKGPFVFGANVRIIGTVYLENPTSTPIMLDNQVLENCHITVSPTGMMHKTTVVNA